ncbi:hypothetical protein niasHT_026670 [Heterodera trifolii]|uniref:Uncharacterized protein n=1 Tax=Heterodera trifolii TaxID=157864 RepID=A0ABD2JSM6_9BILA
MPSNFAKPKERQFHVVPVPAVFTRGRWECIDYKDTGANPWPCPPVSSGSSSNINDKIEQAPWSGNLQDLVKTHLTFAVREEVDILRSTIANLEGRVTLLEGENQILRQYAPTNVIANLPALVQQHQQQQPGVDHLLLLVLVLAFLPHLFGSLFAKQQQEEEDEEVGTGENTTAAGDNEWKSGGAAGGARVFHSNRRVGRSLLPAVTADPCIIPYPVDDQSASSLPISPPPPPLIIPSPAAALIKS